MIIMIIAIGVFCFAAYNLYGILKVYHDTDKEYADIRDKYTTAVETESEPEEGTEQETPQASEEEEPDVPPPLEVDWEDLKSANSDIVGWLYVDAIPDISYPICKGEDNDYYLHHSFEKKYLFSGTIFEDYNNSPYFKDPNTIVYGHNMKNGSMFGKLRRLKEAETLNADPYLWILTPYGNYRYRIFSVFETPYNSDTYTQFTGFGFIVKEWADKMHEQSLVPTDVELGEDDFYVTLSTCTSDSSKRCVAIAKCVSKERPNLNARRKITSASKKDR